MRIAGATFPLLLVFVNTILLPMEKVKHSEIPMAALGVLIVIAWFLVPASFCTSQGWGEGVELTVSCGADAFLTTTVADDNSPLIASKVRWSCALSLARLISLPASSCGSTSRSACSRSWPSRLSSPFLSECSSFLRRFVALCLFRERPLTARLQWFMGLRGAQVAQDIEDQIHEELHDELHDEERQLMR